MDKKVMILNKPEVADLAGEKVMIDFSSGKYFLLKGVANDIWDMLDDTLTIDNICKQLLEVYDIDEDTCKQQVLAFLKSIEEKGFIKLVD